jgi:hypothetical protein
LDFFPSPFIKSLRSFFSVGYVLWLWLQFKRLMLIDSNLSMQTYHRQSQKTIHHAVFMDRIRECSGQQGEIYLHFCALTRN